MKNATINALVVMTLTSPGVVTQSEPKQPQETRDHAPEPTRLDVQPVAIGDEEAWYADVFHHGDGSDVVLAVERKANEIVIDISCTRSSEPSGLDTRLRLWRDDDGQLRADANGWWSFDHQYGNVPNAGWLKDARGVLFVDGDPFGGEDTSQFRFELTGRFKESQQVRALVMGGFSIKTRAPK